jgi:hypothetical protein
MALTVVPSSAFADDPPGTPGDTTGTGTGTDGDDEVDGGDVVDGSEPGEAAAEVDEGSGPEVVTGGPDQAGGDQVEIDAGSEVVSGGNGAITVGGADAIQRDDSAPAIGVQITASPAGDVQLRVRSYVAEEAVVGSQATIFVNVLTDDERERSTDASDEGSDDGSANVALPETGASGNLQPVLAAGIYFTLAGLIVVAATKRHEILVPTAVVRRRRPRVNWE